MDHFIKCDIKINKNESNKKLDIMNDFSNNDIKLLSNKRKLDFRDLIQNLKNKVNPHNNETKTNLNHKSDIDLNVNDFNIIIILNMKINIILIKQINKLINE